MVTLLLLLFCFFLLTDHDVVFHVIAVVFSSLFLLTLSIWVIFLISVQRPQGIFAVIDRYAKTIHGTDSKLVKKLNSKHCKHTRYEEVSNCPYPVFTISHYAGKVRCYLSNYQHFLINKFDSLSVDPFILVVMISITSIWCHPLEYYYFY